MKITVELSDKDLRDVLRYTGEKKKGPAIAKLVAQSLMLKRRRELGDKIMTGKVKIEVPHYETMQELDRKSLWQR